MGSLRGASRAGDSDAGEKERRGSACAPRGTSRARPGSVVYLRGVREPAGHGALPVPHSWQRSCPGLSGAGRVRGAGAMLRSGGVVVCLGFVRFTIQRYWLSKELRAFGEIQSIEVTVVKRQGCVCFDKFLQPRFLVLLLR